MAMAAVAFAPMVTLSSFRKAQFLAAAGPITSSPLREDRCFERNGKQVSRNVVRAVVGERAPGAAVPESAERGVRHRVNF